jgi:hypothetical protein
MNERYENWLDEQLRRTIDSGKVEFDAEQWKRKYSAEYQALLSRAGKHPNALRFLWVRPLVKVAAVVAIVALVIFLIYRRPVERTVQPIAAKPEQSIFRSPEKNGTAAVDRSPTKMLSVLSLSLAYRQGGLDAVDEQCKKVFKMLGQKSTNVSVSELLNEENGKKPERKEL